MSVSTEGPTTLRHSDSRRQRVVCPALLLLALAGCRTAAPPATPFVTPGLTTTIGALEADSIGNLLLSRLVDAESKSLEPDTLFAADAIVVADGEPRMATPRLASSKAGGRIQIVSTRLSARGGFVWGVIEYRWVPSFASGALSQGLATIVIGKLASGGWRILHLHSSSPPERGEKNSTPGEPEVEPEWGAERAQVVGPSPRIVSRIFRAVPGATILMRV